MDDAWLIFDKKIFKALKWVDGVTEEQRKIDVKCDLDLKVILTGLECK